MHSVSRARYMTPEQRERAFWFRCGRFDAEDGSCWIWRRSKRGAYGTMSWFGRTTLTHRIAWMLVNGPIPAGHVVRHRCDEPLCCNPDHLELGTPAENSNDIRMRERAGNRCRRKPGSQSSPPWQ